MEDRSKWNEIISEEIATMIDRLKTRGIDADQFEVNIKTSSIEEIPIGKEVMDAFEDFLEKDTKVEDKTKGVTFEVDDLDEILDQLGKKSRQNVKCSRCGKEIEDFKESEIGEGYFAICKDCLEKLKNNMIEAEPDEESREEMVEDFVNDLLLDYIFDDKEDLIRFLKEAIKYIKDNNIEI